MGAVRELHVTSRIGAMEWDRDEWPACAKVEDMGLYYRVDETYREVQDPDGNWWQNRDGDTLDVKAALESPHLSRMDVRWVDEFADED